MDTSWEAIQTFLAVAETGSFSGAARRLRLGQPTISRRIAGLEEELGEPLFWRGKRGAALSEAGERLLPAAEQMARFGAEFERLAAGGEAEATGVVRIAAPPALSVEFLAPFAAGLADSHPALRLEVLSSVEHVDLSRGTADLAIRTRQSDDPGLVTLGSIPMPMAVFASASYAAARSPGPRPAALDWIAWAPPYDHVWPNPFLREHIPDFVPRFASDDYLVQRAAVAAGLGVMIHERVRPPGGSAADWVELDVGWTLPDGALHLVCARSIRFAPRVRAVARALLEALEAGAEDARRGADR